MSESIEQFGDADMAAAKALLDKKVGDPDFGYIDNSRVKNAFDGLRAAWQADADAKIGSLTELSITATDTALNLESTNPDWKDEPVLDVLAESEYQPGARFTFPGEPTNIVEIDAGGVTVNGSPLGGGSALDDHIWATDPHPQYLRRACDEMHVDLPTGAREWAPGDRWMTEITPPAAHSMNISTVIVGYVEPLPMTTTGFEAAAIWWNDLNPRFWGWNTFNNKARVGFVAPPEASGYSSLPTSGKIRVLFIRDVDYP